ncbi:MAG: hypothetical protein AAFY88_10400 [Acidobacteriota bacterium]
MDYRDRLLGLAETYRAARGLSLARVSTLVRNDGKFFDSMRAKKNGKRRSCTVETYETAISWFDDEWPEDLEWPSQYVERPSAQKVEAA